MKMNNAPLLPAPTLRIALRRVGRLFGSAFVLAALAVTSMAESPQPDKVEGNRTTEGVSSVTVTDSATGVTRHHGVMYFVKEGRAQRVRGKLDLTEGLTVKENGQIIFRTRQSTALREGEVFYLNGVVRPVTAEIRSAVESLVAQAPGNK